MGVDVNVHAKNVKNIKVVVRHSNYGSTFRIKAGHDEICLFVEDKAAIDEIFNPLAWQVHDDRDPKDGE
jgi:hypothetical protein